MRGAVHWEAPAAHAPLVAAAGLAAAALAVVLYRSQLRGAGRGWRAVIPGFRAMAVAAVVASVLRPTILRPASAGQQGRVVAVVDDSPSMSVTDRSRSPAERVAIAAALGELPPGAVRWTGDAAEANLAKVRTLIDEASRAASELDYARGAGRSVDEAARRAAQSRASLAVACESLAKQLASAPKGPKGWPSWSDVAALGEGSRPGLWAELRARAAATGSAIAATRTKLDAELYDADPAVRASADAAVAASRAQLARRIARRVLGGDMRVVGRGGAQSDQAAVVFTDGRGGGLAGGGAGNAAVVCRVTPATVRDVAVRGVDVPAAAFVGDPVPVHVTLGVAGVAGVRVPLHVSIGDTAEMRQVAVGADGVTSVDVAVVPTRAGTATVTASATPTTGEATDRNNSLSREINVRSDRADVTAFVGGDATELSSLRSILSRIPGASATVVDPAGEAAATQPASATAAAHRVIVLDDVPASQLSAEQLDAIHEAVTVGGATLVLAAGRSHWPPDAESETVLEEYLPYPPDADGRELWRTAEGRAMKVGEVDVPVSLSRVTRYLQVPALRAGAHAVLAEETSGAPLLIESKVGRGRVLTLLAETPDRQELWTSLVVYAAWGTALVRPGAAEPAPPMADVTADEAALRRLAEGNGAEVVPLSDCARIPAILSRREPPAPRVIEYRLWDSPYLFLFVTACLTTEWALRKRLGLP